jgi:hypothetical protein
MDPLSALMQIYSALATVGNAVAYLIQWLFLLVGIKVPDWVIKVAFILVMILTLWKIGSTVGKVALVIIALLLITQGARLLSNVLSPMGIHL